MVATSSGFVAETMELPDTELLVILSPKTKTAKKPKALAICDKDPKALAICDVVAEPDREEEDAAAADPDFCKRYLLLCRQIERGRL